MERLRNVEPPVYNKSRLNELPVPDIGVQNHAIDNSIHDSAVNDDAFEMDQNDHVENGHFSSSDITDEIPMNEMNNSQNINDADPLADTLQDSTNLNDNLNASAVIDQSTSQRVKLEYVPLFDIHSANNGEIELLLDEQEEIVCNEDVVMMVGQSGIPPPWEATNDGFIKRQSDPMSGNIPFNTSV